MNTRIIDMLTVFLILFIITIFTTIVVKIIQLDQNCTGYLSRAANANTIELAKEELNKALNYIEANKLTEGYTSVIYKTPDEDLFFWYNNIKASYNELNAVDENATQLERSNLLMKLRESLTESSSKGKTEVIYPFGLSRYPNNLLWGILHAGAWISIILVILLFIIRDEYY